MELRAIVLTYIPFPGVGDGNIESNEHRDRGQEVLDSDAAVVQHDDRDRIAISSGTLRNVSSAGLFEWDSCPTAQRQD